MPGIPSASQAGKWVGQAKPSRWILSSSAEGHGRAEAKTSSTDSIPDMAVSVAKSAAEKAGDLAGQAGEAAR